MAREFRGLLDGGVRLRVAGELANEPHELLALGYAPKHKIELFDATIYLGNVRSDDNFRFFVGYIRIGRGAFDARLLYKDSSLVWRSATHYIWSEQENWVGKGDLKEGVVEGEVMEYSAEETTNLPFEMQAALEDASRRGPKVRRDLRAMELVLRRAPDDRMEPYDDFTRPRRNAMARVEDRVNRGDFVAWFDEPGVPESLRFAPGFAPDFDAGVVDESSSKSRIYGGEIRKLRILSHNREIQYLFIAAPRQVWIIHPQTTTRELSTYGVRTVDVNADEDVFVPGYEYHFLDDSEDPPVFLSQIPEGFAGAQSEVDPSRADASPWIERLPVIAEFRKKRL